MSTSTPVRPARRQHRCDPVTDRPLRPVPAQLVEPAQTRALPEQHQPIADHSVALHVVYRCEPDGGWRGRVVADDATVEADSLPAARHQLWDVLTHRVEAWPFDAVVEHAEHAVGDGLWVREALDERAPRRARTARVLYETLGDHQVRAELAGLPPAADDGVTVVACVPGDALRWVAEQYDEAGAMVVATAIANHQVWWNTLVEPTVAEAHGQTPALSLTDLGLLHREAAVDEWMAHSVCGQLATLARLPAPSACPDLVA